MNFFREMYFGYCGYKVIKFDAYVYSVDVVIFIIEIYILGGVGWLKFVYCDLCCSVIFLIF